MCFCVLTALTAAQDGDEQEEIVVTAIRPAITVTGVRRCTADESDPIIQLKVRPGLTDQSLVTPDRLGRLARLPDDERIEGPDIWQRAGKAIGDYRFRSGEATRGICIGAAAARPAGHAQLRKIVKADGAHGRYLHFSALAATRRVDRVHFWLVAGVKGRGRALGGNTEDRPLVGTTGWRQIDLVVGPVPVEASHISYGVLLHGAGDVWVRDSRLEILTRDQAVALKSLPLSPVAGSHVPPNRN